MGGVVEFVGLRFLLGLHISAKSLFSSQVHLFCLDIKLLDDAFLRFTGVLRV